jgi:hypothetical protein
MVFFVRYRIKPINLKNNDAASDVIFGVMKTTLADSSNKQINLIQLKLT